MVSGPSPLIFKKTLRGIACTNGEDAGTEILRAELQTKLEAIGCILIGILTNGNQIISLTVNNIEHTHTPEEVVKLVENITHMEYAGYNVRKPSLITIDLHQPEIVRFNNKIDIVTYPKDLIISKATRVLSKYGIHAEVTINDEVSGTDLPLLSIHPHLHGSNSRDIIDEIIMTLIKENGIRVGVKLC